MCVVFLHTFFVYLIFPVEQLLKYFDVIAKYREKKSGSSSWDSANKSDFEYAMGIAGLVFDFIGLDIIFDIYLDGVNVLEK